MPKNNQRPFHILMTVANNTYPADVRVRNEARALIDAGYAVTVIAPRDPKETGEETIDGVHVKRYSLPTFPDSKLGYLLEFLCVTFFATAYVIKVWAQRDFDVLHVHNPPDTLFTAALLPRLAGKKFVFDHHDLAPELFLAKYGKTGGFLYRTLKLLERVSCMLANKVITVNESYKANDVFRNYKKSTDIVVVRNGPLLKQLQEAEIDVELRKKASTIFGYLGHISRQDGVDHLLKALFHLEVVYNYKDWYCIVIGPSDDFVSLKQLASELGVTAKVEFVGYQPDAQWRKLLATSDVCVVPDPANPLNEKSTMIKLMEYMALGKPVVAYDLTENRVSGGDAALYATPSQPESMAECLYRLATDKPLRSELGATGRARIESGLAWEFSALKLVAAYDHLTHPTELIRVPKQHGEY